MQINHLRAVCCFSPNSGVANSMEPEAIRFMLAI